MPMDTIAHYTISTKIGQGGMDEVYLAQDTRLGRKVAIKVLPGEYAGDPERLASSEQEARAAAVLTHPNIALASDVGHEGRVHCIVQEFFEGEPLEAHLNDAVEVEAGTRVGSFGIPKDSGGGGAGLPGRTGS